MNVADAMFKTLEDFTLEETKNMRKDLKGLQRTEFEIKEAITSLECWLMDVISTIDTLKAEVKILKEGVEFGGSTLPNHDREARVETPKLFQRRA